MTRAATIWVILGLLVLALLAYFAFGGARETEQVAEQTATTTAQAFDGTAVRAQAAADLTALKVRAEAGETYESLAADFAQVRARTAAAYENAEGAAAEEWAELDADFDSFEASARAGTGNFLDSVSALISRFSADVRVETAAE